MTERPAATLAVSCSHHHPSRVRRKLSSFHRRGWSRQARRGSRHCHESILPPDGCWRPAPLGGLSGCHTGYMLFFSTATSLPLLCRTWKWGIGGKGELRHLARIRWIQRPFPSSTSIAVIFPYLSIRARSDHFLAPSLSSSSFAMITPGLRD